MRKCVLLLMVLSLLPLFTSCGSGAPGAASEAPELFKAVPSDALGLGYFSRLDRALDRLTDSTSVLRAIDYGKLSRAKAVVSLCDVGSIVPLVAIEAGKAAPDTMAAAAGIIAQADSVRLQCLHATLGEHNVLFLSPSETAITIAGRHLQSGSSILEAPDFDKVVAALPGGDVMVYRNRGAVKIFGNHVQGRMRSSILSFVRDASEWMVVSDDVLIPVQPDAEKYFYSFCSSREHAPSKFGTMIPAGTDFYIDIPIPDLANYRVSYELWLDARVALEEYNARLASVWKAKGKDPRVWEKDLGVREVAVASYPFGRVNFLRVKDKESDKGVSVNPWTGYVRALYGDAFNPADSCMMRSGNWIISGSRKALDSLSYDAAIARDWPAKAKAVAGTPSERFVWNKDNIVNLWHSNR